MPLGLSIPGAGWEGRAAGEDMLPRDQARTRSGIFAYFGCDRVKPVSHFAAFCASLTQSEDRWEGQPLKLEPWQKRFWREALDDWRSVVLVVARKNGKTSMLAAYDTAGGGVRPAGGPLV